KQRPLETGFQRVFSWWTGAGSNRRPLRCERSALPAELPARDAVVAVRAPKLARHTMHYNTICRLCPDARRKKSESSLSGHEAGLGLLSRCPGDDPVHQTRDTSRAVPAHICNGNAGLEHTKALVRNPLCKAGGLSFDVL